MARDLERREQCALFKWAAMESVNLPELRLLFAVPNGMAAKSPVTVAKMKAEGLRPGVPDVWLPVTMDTDDADCVEGEYVGLALELKVPPNKLTNPQTEWAVRLKQHGWFVVAPCWGFEHARDAILRHLTGSKMEPPAVYQARLQQRYGGLLRKQRA